MKRELSTDSLQPWVYLIGDGVTSQSIPNETWTTVNFASAQWDNIDDGFLPWRAGTPSRLYVPEDGNFTQIWEVSFAFDATETGVRGIRTRATVAGIGTFTAEGPVFVPGIANPTGNDAATGQHLQIANWGPNVAIGDYGEIQVYQNSGGALDLVADGLAAPQCMAWYTDY